MRNLIFIDRLVAVIGNAPFLVVQSSYNITNSLQGSPLLSLLVKKFWDQICLGPFPVFFSILIFCTVMTGLRCLLGSPPPPLVALFSVNVKVISYLGGWSYIWLTMLFELLKKGWIFYVEGWVLKKGVPTLCMIWPTKKESVPRRSPWSANPAKKLTLKILK